MEPGVKRHVMLSPAAAANPMFWEVYPFKIHAGGRHTMDY